MDLKKKISLYILCTFYVFGGINHFVNPDFYYKLIPDYLPWHITINIISGLAEIMLGIGMLFKQTRKISAYGIIAMLIAFIPSHVYFIQIGGCVEDGLCAPLWIGWVRLVIIHPILIGWVWIHRT